MRPVIPKRAITSTIVPQEGGEIQSEDQETNTGAKEDPPQTSSEEPLAEKTGQQGEPAEVIEPPIKSKEKAKPKDIEVNRPQHPTKTKKAPETADQKGVVPSATQPSTPTKSSMQQTPSATTPSTKKPKTIHVGVKAQEGSSTTQSGSPGGQSVKEIGRRTSTTSLQQPATPSDSASFTTTTLSRANSPPPSRVGTAPVRPSKTQQKKERQARAKQVEAEKKTEQPPEKAEEPAVVQEPIIGRKKKTKKAKQATTTAESTPSVSRAASPERKQPMTTKEDPPKPSPAQELPSKETSKPVTEPPSEAEAMDETAARPITQAEDTTSSSTITPQALLTSLLDSGEMGPNAKDLFHQVPSYNTRFETNSDLLTTQRPFLTSEQTKLLDSGKLLIVEDPLPSRAAHGGGKEARFTIVLPDRKPLPGFTKQQAERFVELTERVGGTPSLPRELDGIVKLPRLTSLPSTTTGMGVGDGGVDGAADAIDAVQEGGGSGGEELYNRWATSTNDVAVGGMGEYSPASVSAGAMTTSPYGFGGAAYTGAGLGAQTTGTVVMSVEEAERVFVASRKETEGIEKKLNALIKKNRRVLLGGH